MPKDDLTSDLRENLRSAWADYLAEVGSFCGSLHGYCRRLTGDVWDAEDLLQDTLIRGFAALSSLHRKVRAPRSYLLRIATNLWIDRLRLTQKEGAAFDELSGRADQGSRATEGNVRDAAVLLLGHLPAQERAALLLKEAFGMTLSEIAEVLGTTVGAVKSALHRGRSRIRPDMTSQSPRSIPSSDLVERFVEHFNAADRTALLELVLDNAEVEHVGVFHQHGVEAKKSKTSWFSGALGQIPDAPDAGFDSQRAEVALFQDEPLVLLFRTRDGREILEEIVRLSESNAHVSRLRSYGSCPETMKEVCMHLGT